MSYDVCFPDLDDSDHGEANRTTVGYNQVTNGRKQRVRGLWERNRVYYAQIRVVIDGTTAPRRLALKNPDNSPRSTVPEARAAMSRLQDKRTADALPTHRQAPKLVDYVKTYLADIAPKKRPETVRKEAHHPLEMREKPSPRSARHGRKRVVDFYCRARTPRTCIPYRPH